MNEPDASGAGSKAPPSHVGNGEVLPSAAGKSDVPDGPNLKVLYAALALALAAAIALALLIVLPFYHRR